MVYFMEKVAACKHGSTELIVCAGATSLLTKKLDMKKGILVKTVEWRKHLRPFFKKRQWGKERAATKKDIRDRLREGS